MKVDDNKLLTTFYRLLKVLKKGFRSLQTIVNIL